MSELTNEVAAVAPATNVVEFTDANGVVTTRDFGKKGQIQKEVAIDESGITVNLFLVTGVATSFTFARDNALFDTMAARGVIEYIGNSIAGVYQDKEGTHPEDFNLGIEKAISNLQSGVIPTREASDKSTKGLGDLIRAYVELRTAAGTFSEEESSYAFIKDLILGSEEVTNKQRLAQAPVKAKIEQYKLERQQARAAAANEKAGVIADLI